jgi:CheY-specific phosphatase CheX
MELNNRSEATVEELHRQTVIYLKETLNLEVFSIEKLIDTLETIELREITAIITLSGVNSFSIAFSFNTKLSYEILRIQSHEHGLDIDESEYVSYSKYAIAEMANIILGLSCAQLQEESQLLTISPPLVLEKSCKLHRPKKASFSQLTIKTNFGDFDVNCIAPSTIFNNNLNINHE